MPSRHAVDATLLRSLGIAAQGQGADYITAARVALARMVATPGLLDTARLERRPGGLARNLLFGDEAMSVWAMVWGAGASTSVHDHHCSCCFGVLSGALREVWFKAVGEGAAAMTGQATREAGFVACMLPSGPNLHQMVNDGAGEAISIHIYGFDHRLHPSSVDREYRAVAH